ncbi:hypothetical protein TOPH_02946 [Tolypocladium ophioglossoides CBS 100239]|uniref:F-box domain-containing protein n=1 Tax=Tolypocladium ophioglossoides (strain CBS 100239) TaxID=1163406 RepID=A0A0L0NEI3_TOLOC|nr:hypothetical protein TOPH_02946 [Tolypocladium ophioglossoides CBS 100239]
MAQTPRMSLALTLPEILIDIFDLLEPHRPTLAAAIRVNRQWFASGTDVLWRGALCEALAKVPGHRRQVYASKITSISFYGEDEVAYHSCFENLQFSRLRKIVLDVHHQRRPGAPEWYPIQQYLQPPLEEFAFFGGYLDDLFLEHMLNTCFRLRSIMLHNPRRSISAEAFCGFITRCTWLTNMEFSYRMEHLISDELVLHLAKRTTLLNLVLGKIISMQILRQISRNVVEPFKALRSLHISITALAVPLLVPLVKHITSLRLEVEDSDDSAHILQLISRLADLRFLSLSFAAHTELSTEDLLSLRALSKLEQLSINADCSGDAAAVTAFNPGFSNSDFDSLCSALHCLRRIDFNVMCNMSAAALKSLQRYHPLLEECSLPLIFDMHALGLDKRRRVMFPELRLLDVGAFRPPPAFSHRRRAGWIRPAAHVFAALMRRRFPKLEELYVQSDDSYSTDVVDAFETSMGR